MEACRPAWSVKHGGRLAAAALVCAAPALGGITVYQEGDKKLELGGLLQVEYVAIDPDCEPGADCWIDTSFSTSTGTFDRTFFRRLRPYVQGTVTRHWAGKIEVDFGEAEADDELLIKDAFVEYTGFSLNESGPDGKRDRRLVLRLGNTKPPFGREFITSSSKQQLVERSIVGDHNFGTPDRALGLKLDGKTRSGRAAWGVMLGEEHHDPAAARMDFDTPVNNEADWNQGWLTAARVDFHPLGEMPYDQADFEGAEWKLTLSAGVFRWSNDDDNNPYTLVGGGTACSATDAQECKADLDRASGVEISAGVRGRGLSVDVELHRVSGDTVDGAFTGGLYRNGTTRLDALAVEGGYMIDDEHFEVVLGWDSLDADNYNRSFERSSVGLNYYWNRHNAKASLTYRMVNDFLGNAGQDQNVLFGLAQFVF
jgi:hypothetical protein